MKRHPIIAENILPSRPPIERFDLAGGVIRSGRVVFESIGSIYIETLDGRLIFIARAHIICRQVVPPHPPFLPPALGEVIECPPPPPTAAAAAPLAELAE